MLWYQKIMFTLHLNYTGTVMLISEKIGIGKLSKFWPSLLLKSISSPNWLSNKIDC